MFDISDPVNPSEPSGAKGPKPKSHVKGEFSVGDDKGGKQGQPTEKFLGMEVTKAQKEKIYANLCNSVIAQMRKDAKRQKKALENLKRSEKGEPPIP